MKCLNLVLATAICLLMVTGQAQAVKFDPLFRVTAIQGECQIKAKGENAFAPAQNGKAYHYGSHIKTGRNSSLVILLADGNECQVLANADLTMDQDTTDPKLKVIKLRAGTVDVDLPHEFDSDGYGLQVETAAAICGVIGSKGSVSVRSDNEMSVTTLGVQDGTWFAKGAHFQVKELDADDFLSVAISLDREFTRVKNIKGQYDISCKNSAGEWQNLDLKLNSIVKIWAREADVGKNVTVTIIFTSPDGKVDQTFTYTEADLRDPKDIADTRKEIKDAIRARLEDIDNNDTIVTTTTTTTSTVTTSTTLPSTTPVGRR